MLLIIKIVKICFGFRYTLLHTTVRF